MARLYSYLKNYLGNRINLRYITANLLNPNANENKSIPNGMDSL